MTRLTYTVATQRCTCCEKVKAVSDFYKQSYTGLPAAQCKECQLIKKRVARQRERHSKFVSKEKIRGMEAVDYTLSDWEAAMLHFGGRCCYCGKAEGRAKKSRFDREHLIPLSRGGKTVRNNIAPSCRACNRARGNKNLFEWFRAQSAWSQEREDRIVEWMSQQP